MNNTKNRIQRFVLLMIILSVIFVTGCGKSGTDTNSSNSVGSSPSNEANSSYNEISGGEMVASYEEDAVPGILAKSGDNWFAIQQTYGTGEYTIGYGTSPDSIEAKSSISTGEIWNLSADGDYATWGERNESEVKVMVYDSKSDKVEQVALLTEDRENYKYQQSKVHTKDGKVYYLYSDYDADKLKVMCYDMATGEESVVAEDDSAQNVGCFAMRDNTIIIDSTGEQGEPAIGLVDITSGKIEKIDLPDGMDYVWEADVNGDTIATYYYDSRPGNNAWNEADNIAVFQKGEEDVVPIFSFPNTNTGATYYACNDDIELFGDYILWVYQQNTSGDILDHYDLTIYNYKTNDYHQEPATFNFAVDGDDLCWATWNENINKVEIYKAK